jgi:hypothetical protein
MKQGNRQTFDSTEDPEWTIIIKQKNERTKTLDTQQQHGTGEETMSTERA